MNQVAAILKRYEMARTDRDFMAPTWREIADYIRPTRQGIAVESGRSDFSEVPNVSRIAALFDTTAVDANLIYSAGVTSGMTPGNTPWFALDAPMMFQGDDEIRKFYGNATEEMRQEFSLSNFYGCNHEAILDDGAFGTCGLMLEETSSSLRFETLEIGNYAICENEFRKVDTIFRDFKLSVRQAAQKFGEAALHPEMRKLLTDDDAKKADQKYEFLHVIMPRQDAERIAGMLDAQNMPWASIYIDKKNKIIVQNGGSWENPAFVHRHLLWSHMPYGFSPGLVALPDCRQLNFMQQFLDTLVEKQVSPPVLVPAGYEGTVDLRADGQTFFEDETKMPRFWQNPGNYMIGEDRVTFRQRQIKTAFHVDLFQALAQVPVGKVMTAAEVMQRRNESLPLFSPTFDRKNDEIYTPLVRRAFSIMLRAGAFGQIPQKLLQVGPDGMATIPDPQVIYTSSLAMQMKALSNNAFDQTLGRLGPVMAIRPELMDHFDLDKASRDVARNQGWREDWLRPDFQVQAIRRDRAAQEEAARQEALALEQADTVAGLAGAGVPMVA